MNKSDITSKEYLLAEIDDLADEFSELDENGLHSERWCGIMDAKQIIINAPFVSDRPQGEWIEMGQNENGTHNVKCNQCNNSYKIRGHAKSIYTRYNYKFCPHCGARMKGAIDETEIS